MDATTWWKQYRGADLSDHLRQLANAYPEDIFIPGGDSRDAIAADAMRIVARPALLQAAEEIDRLLAVLRQVRSDRPSAHSDEVWTAVVEALADR